MNNSILNVHNVSKSFRDYGSEINRVLSWFGVRAKIKEEHHILHSVSFSIAPGEAVGIVGQNGAGKSTLLKIITGTLKPSNGVVHIDGRISAILELGMGFHPDLTGRQNVYHSAGLMGYKREEIEAVIDEIENFAEIGEYFDQPVRTYSSGMQMRVAFGVATAYRPSILIVDEALSVGDAYFQHKSFDRIRKFQKEGTSLLIVSHDKAAIQAICDRAILLEKGQIIKDGNPEEVMDYYNALIAEKEHSKVKQVVQENGKVATVSGTGEATIDNVTIFNTNDEKIDHISVGESVNLKIRVKVHAHIDQLVLGYMIKDRLGQSIFGTNTHHSDNVIRDLEKDEVIDYCFSFPMNLGVGSYSIAVALHAHDTHVSANYEWRDQALLFNVINVKEREFVGLAWLPQKVEVKNVK